ncbi:MAG: type IV secretory system conjugative DNA transfer family protein [Alphaproteobacteria bacterium]|nr:type IV secretory system conjugative DNA transfer family protein [Alphaproteobacteria bacterium]
MAKLFENDKQGEHHKAARWLLIAFIIQGILTYIAAILSFPLSYLVNNGFEWERLQDPVMQEYFRMILLTGGFYVFFQYYHWAMAFVAGYTTSIIPAIPIFSIFAVESWLRGIVPHKSFWGAKADGRIALEPDIVKMGLFNGFIIVLGKWKKKFLKFKETLSALCFAPPGAGKTTAIVVPTIFECDGVSMIINDPKPELCFNTSGYRSKIGPVFILNWAKQDNPQDGVYYPNWNPLTPGIIPAPGPNRDLYIDSMVNVFVEDPKGSSADPHWSKTGRNALSGFIHFICSKCENANASEYFHQRLKDGTFSVADAQQLEHLYAEMKDSYAEAALTLLRDGKLNSDNYVPCGTWADMPKRWQGREACFPMLLDWISEAQINISEDIRKRKEGGDQMAGLADPMKDMLDNTVMEARRFGYSHRSILEMTQLANTPDKERGSIMSTALSGISVFKNQAVRQRTSNSDFSFKDLRGMVDPADGVVKPVTVYLSVNAADAKAMSVISGVFVELMSNYLISNPPGTKQIDGSKAGPFPVLFVLDEFPQMPKLQAVLEGPAVGRGQKVSYLLIAQDLAQITEGYGPNAVETLMSTTAAKILLTQNNDTTAKRFSELFGKKSEVNIGFKNNTVLNSFKVEDTYEVGERQVISVTQILGLKPTEVIISMQGFAKFPILAEAPRYFTIPDLLAKSKLPGSVPVPEWIRAKRNS